MSRCRSSRVSSCRSGTASPTEAEGSEIELPSEGPGGDRFPEEVVSDVLGAHIVVVDRRRRREVRVIEVRRASSILRGPI